MTPSHDYLESMALIIGGAMTISLMFGILLGAVFTPTLNREDEHPGRADPTCGHHVVAADGGPYEVARPLTRQRAADREGRGVVAQHQA
ncbi:hypothetical protein [Actinomadura verrucosospora]|uniref:hypothetical protein n=1 Tax=Actinomadura verrucosospora TaxID=46165 RepID=UPI0015671830|nr:hypothetical protein [Actinomadura verrucosospora]